MLKIVCSVFLDFRCLAPEQYRLFTWHETSIFLGCLRLAELFRFTRKVVAARLAKFAIGAVFGYSPKDSIKRSI